MFINVGEIDTCSQFHQHFKTSFWVNITNPNCKQMKNTKKTFIWKICFIIFWKNLDLEYLRVLYFASASSNHSNSFRTGNAFELTPSTKWRTGIGFSVSVRVDVADSRFLKRTIWEFLVFFFLFRKIKTPTNATMIKIATAPTAVPIVIKL